LKILLNFVPSKVGGAVQRGLDFLEQVELLGRDHTWYLVATKGTPFENNETRGNLNVVQLVPNNIPKRLWFEFVGCRRLVQDLGVDLVFSLTSGPWLGKRVIHIVGCSNPYVAYPDAFQVWGKEPFTDRLRLRLQVWYNAMRLRAADTIIFQSKAMAAGAIDQNRINSDNVRIVKGSCSWLVRPELHDSSTAAKCARLPRGYRVLLLAGYSPHKNIFILPKIAAILKDIHHIKDVVFITTLAPKHPRTAIFFEESKRRGVESMIYNIGPIPQAGCSELYSVVDVVILPSRIESFSNTIAESWNMKKPLLISDLDWARELCGDGALYFKYDNAGEAASKLLELRNDPSLSNQLINAGVKMLKTYPSAEERFMEYLRIIEGKHTKDAFTYLMDH
jgi:glycosyltransferase involved in cell wall biosynthesis